MYGIHQHKLWKRSGLLLTGAVLLVSAALAMVRSASAEPSDRSAAYLRVTAVDDRGEAVENARVIVIPPGESIRNALRRTTNARGEQTFRVLPRPYSGRELCESGAEFAQSSAEAETGAGEAAAALKEAETALSDANAAYQSAMGALTAANEALKAAEAAGDPAAIAAAQSALDDASVALNNALDAQADAEPAVSSAQAANSEAQSAAESAREKLSEHVASCPTCQGDQDDQDDQDGCAIGAALMESVNSAQGEMHSVESDLINEEANLGDLESELTYYEQIGNLAKVEELQTKIRESRAKIESLRTKVESCRVAYERVRDQLDDHQSSCEICKRRVLNLGSYRILVMHASYEPAGTTKDLYSGRTDEVRLTLKPKAGSDTASTVADTPPFDPCNKPGWIHATRIVKMTDQRIRAGEGVFTAEYWVQERSRGGLSGEGKYYYYKLDPNGGGMKGEKKFAVSGTINNEFVVLDGDGDMEVVGFGGRTTREPVVIWDFMRKFEGTMKNDIYSSGPDTPIAKYNVVYVVQKTNIQRCNGDEPEPIIGGDFPGTVIERPPTYYPAQIRPVNGARVQVAGETADGTPFEIETTTDGVGTFVAANVPPGTHKVTISAAGHDALIVSQAVTPGMKPPVFQVHVTGLPPDEGAPIAGLTELNVNVFNARQKEAPVPYAEVTMFDKTPHGLTFKANDFGRFDTFLSPGQYRYRASATGYATKQEAFSASGSYEQLKIYLNPTGPTPDVEPSEEVSKYEKVEPRGIGRQTFPVRVARGGTVEVIVSDNPSNPMKHELVSTAPGLRKSGRDYQSVERQPGVIGGPRGKYHYKFIAERDGQIVFHMTRPWESRPTLVAVIEVTVVE